jgi:dienelactone hydrolase
MFRRFVAILMLLSSGAALAAVRGEEVTYKSGDVTLKGYIAYDDAIQGKRPGILVVHEWWGLNDYARKRARMLAELGYTALAVDMYGSGKTADHPDNAQRFMSEVANNLPLMKRRFQAAEKVLKKHKTVDDNRLGAIGYCFGGAVVLNMARQGERLAGVVSFHGSLSTSEPARPGRVKAQVLVLNGADDPFAAAGQIAAFKKEMDDAGIKYRFVNYPGAKHGFTNPDADAYGRKFNMPLAYNREADEKSWAEMQAFFSGLFRKQ